MKRALIPALIFLAACGNPQGEVQLTGSTPLRPQDKDIRGVRGYCGACGKTLDYGAKKCAGKKCGAVLTWKDTVDCSFCGATGKCKACDLLGQKDQACFNCNGEGQLIFQGTAKECQQCEASGTCRICKEQPGSCDACGGSKQLNQGQIQEYSKPRGAHPDTE